MVKLNVRQWGEGNPATAVLLHGITANQGAWVRIGPALAERGFHVFAPELRGHGDSEIGEANDSATLLDDLASVVPTNPDLLIGHSFGGYLAQLGILRNVFQPGVLVLEDPVSHQPDPEWASGSLTRDETTIPRSIEGLSASNPRWQRVEVAWKVLSLEQVDWKSAHEQFAGNAPWDLRPDAAAVAARQPTLWVLPGESIFVPAGDVERLRAEVGDERIRIAPDAGHSIHRDEFDLFLAWVDQLLVQKEADS